MEEGEFLSLLGPSGCGKSTLMKTLAGILPARSGRIYLDGRDITDMPIHKRGIVVVFRDMRLFPHKSVAENVAFPLKMQGIPKTERLKTAAYLLKKVQMEDFASRKPGELSGGQQQRIALAWALAAQPKLLLLFDGELSQTGTPRQVYDRPENKQVADYFGNCVYVPGYVSNGRFSAHGISCEAAVPDGAYRIMLRPEALQIDPSGTYPLTVAEVSFRGSDVLVSFLAADGTLWKKSCPRDSVWRPVEKVFAGLGVENPVLFAGE